MIDTAAAATPTETRHGAPKPLPASVWDPFAGARPFAQGPVPQPKAGLAFPPFAGQLAFLGIALAFAAVVFGALTEREGSILAGMGLGTVAVVALIAMERFRARPETQAALYREVALRSGWAFEYLDGQETPRPGTMPGAGKNEPQNLRAGLARLGQMAEDAGDGGEEPGERAAGRAIDPRLAPASRTIPELLAPRVGEPIVPGIDAMYWGRTSADVPFWLAVKASEGELLLAARTLKTDAYGNTGTDATLFHAIAAYDLARDTGLRARLMSQRLPGEGRDLKTESGAFNRAFDISVQRAPGEGGEAALLRALTPATQATLLDLRRRFRVRLVVDGPTVYVSGWDMINAHDPEIVAAYFGRMLDDFAEAATSFKRYME